MFVLESIARSARDGAVATIYSGGSMSYSELDRRSSSFAAYLLKKGGKTPVVICGHRQPDFLTCMFGSLKAGRAYVPIDISFPPDRVNQVLDDVNPDVIVDFTGSIDNALSQADIDKICDSLDPDTVTKNDWVQAEDTCYIMFTSGSTGKPKGVPINRRNLENMYRSAKDICDTGEKHGIALNCVSYSFDLSVMSVYVAVGLGMTLYSIDKETTENYKALFTALSDSGISFWVSTPSFAEVCTTSADFNSALLPGIKKFFFCGEILTNKLAGQLLDRFPGAEVLNTYGPTEATVFVTSVEITEDEAEAIEPLPVGRFFDSIIPKIVDGSGNKVPEGEKGELLIIGDSVSMGYFMRPDLTAKSFFDIQTENGVKRGYRTGDICFMRDGMLHYSGRNDLQIKLNGFRIEIEDVEKNLMKLKKVKRAAVCPISEGGKVSYLVAFILLEGESELPKLKQITALKNELKEFVPAYMVPRKIVLMDSLPTNANGKVDKKALLLSLDSESTK